MPKVIDANVIVRFLVAESPALVAKIKNYLNSQEKIVLTDVTIAEIIWGLTSYYKFEKRDVLEKIQSLLEAPNFVINRPVIV
ncbi:PIN domain-containing protein, partial [Candidatus Gottesmanbacteria bacterium]|nr:PIN domain-containing protein [Candidatus Gottesmanbacteria bacterium]